MKLKQIRHYSKASRRSLALIFGVSISSLSAQNTTTTSGAWDTSFSNTPERQDGVTTTSVAGTLATNDNTTGETDIGQGYETNAGGQGVHIVGGNTIEVDGTSSAIAASSNVNGASTAIGGAGYAETGHSLSVGDNGQATTGTGTLNITGGRLDVGMVNGGTFLQGDGDANAGTVDANVGALSVDGNYRNVSYYNSVNNNNDSDSNDIYRQYYMPTDVYDVSASAANTAGATTGDAYPLHLAGGSLNIGSGDDGVVNISGGELNVVQYGWNWASDGGSSVDWVADGTLNNSGNDGGTNASIQAISDNDYNSDLNNFEGYGLDYNTGAYDTNGTDANRNDDNNNAANYMFVDAESLENSYAQPGTNLTTTVGGGEGDFQFSDPNFENNSWDNREDGSRGPYADYVNEGQAIPAGSVDGELVDHLHQIVRTGGNINVGNSGGATGTFNISDAAIVTTNNIVVGRQAIDDAGVPADNTTGVVNMSGGDVFMRESLIVASGHADRDAEGTQGTFNHTGGKLEAVNDFVIGANGDGIVNLDAAASPDNHVIVGDDITIATGRFGDGTLNLNGTLNLLSSEREGSGTNNIILGGQSYGANSSNIATVNYNPGAGEIGDVSLANEWDNIIVGSSWLSAGEFNHENENVISLDSSFYTGDGIHSKGATYIGVDDTNGEDNVGGITVDDHFVVGRYGRGIVMHDEGTVKIADDGGGNLYIGQYGNIDTPYQWIGNDGLANNDDPYTNPDLNNRADPAIPVFDTATAEGVVIAQEDIDAGHSVGIYEVRDSAILDTPNAYVGKAGIGYLNYSSTEDLNIDTFVQVGGDYTGYGELNIDSTNIAVNLDTDGAGNNDFVTGRSGTGVTSIGQGTVDADGCHLSDGTGAGVAFNAGANNNVVIGSAATTESDVGNEISLITDAGDGTFNLNGAGATITQGAGNNIVIGTGDNVSEGIEFREQNGNSNLIDMSTAGVATNIMNPFDSTQNQANTARDGTAADSVLLSGSAFGTQSTSTAETLTTGEPAVPVILSESDGSTDNTVNWVAGPDDGKGSIGHFNHNNDWAPTFQTGTQLNMAEGDNSIATYNQNGTGKVSLGDSSGLIMSQDGFDTGDASASAADAISTPMSFEMGQSTYSVNNAAAIFDLGGYDITGGSIDVAGGDGAAVHDTNVGSLVQGGLQDRANEAQINLYQGRIENTNSSVNADIVVLGTGTTATDTILEISETGGTGAETLTLTNNHDFTQLRSGQSATPPGCTTAVTTAGSQIEFTMVEANVSFANTVDDPITGPDPISYINPEDWNATSTSSSTFGGLTSANTGSEIDTIVADHIDFSYDTASILLNFDEGALATLEAGMYWDLADFASFDTSDFTDHESMDVFAYRDASGVVQGDISDLLTGLTGANGNALRWSVDSADTTSANAAPDIWDTHGIIYIYEEGQILPEPSSALLAALGGLTLIGRRKRKA